MNIKITQLPSGLTILTDTMPDIASATLGLFVGVGTRFETAAQGGLSHLLEHMFFKGTTTRPAKLLNQTIENVGGSLNAYTSREQTAYHARVLGADVPLALELLADMRLNSTFRADDLAREKSVIASEIGEAYDAPDDWVFDLFQLTAYADQPLGRPVLGTVDTLEGISPDDLRAYVGTHYLSGNTVLAAAGAVDHAQLVALAQQHLAALPQQQQPEATPARYTGGTAVEARDTEQLHIALGHRGVTYSHKLFQAQALFAMSLGGGSSSRLFHEVREERAMAYSVSAFIQPFADDAVLNIYIAADPAKGAEALKISLEQLHTLAETMSEAELERAKALTRAGLLMGLESSESRAERLAGHWYQYGRIIPVEETLASLNAVTLQDIRTYASLVLASPVTRTAVGPVDTLGWT